MWVDIALVNFTVKNQEKFQNQQQRTRIKKGNKYHYQNQISNPCFHISTHNAGLNHTTVYHVDSEIWLMKTHSSKHIKEILKHPFLLLCRRIYNDYGLIMLLSAVDNEVRAY